MTDTLDHFSAAPPASERADEVLREIGLPEDLIQQLRTLRAIAWGACMESYPMSYSRSRVKLSGPQNCSPMSATPWR